MNAEEMWREFCRVNSLSIAEYDAWSFGDDADRLAELVLCGKKSATSSAYALYEIEREPLPDAGEYSVILDSDGDAKCIIRTTKVYVIPLNKISKSHAFKEGEGDRSLNYWRDVHKRFFTECLEEAGIPFSGSMEVVCEEFEVVYK